MQPPPQVRVSSLIWLLILVLQDQLAALVGHSGTISAGAVVTVICCLLVVNAVFYLGFMHLIYHILLRYPIAWRHLLTLVDVGGNPDATLETRAYV